MASRSKENSHKGRLHTCSPAQLLPQSHHEKTLDCLPVLAFPFHDTLHQTGERKKHDIHPQTPCSPKEGHVDEKKHRSLVPKSYSRLQFNSKFWNTTTQSTQCVPRRPHPWVAQPVLTPVSQFLLNPPHTKTDHTLFCLLFAVSACGFFHDSCKFTWWVPREEM